MILAILQARMSSTRLPGKSMATIAGRPMLALQLERVMRSSLVDAWLVATSDLDVDTPIQRLCMEMGVCCFRGDHADVLGRFYHAGRVFAPSHVLRLTGDCPMSDPELIDLVIDRHLTSDCQYSSNALERSYPDGLDVEVMRWESLVQAMVEAQRPSQREHVTAYIYQHPERFRLNRVKNEVDCSRHRWAVDHREDLELVRELFSVLYPQNPRFSWRDALELVESRPELAKINAMHDVDEGWNRSIHAEGGGEEAGG